MRSLNKPQNYFWQAVIAQRNKSVVTLDASAKKIDSTDATMFDCVVH